MFRQKFLISVVVAGCCAIPASAALVGYCGAGPCSASSGFAAATATDTFQNIDVTTGILIGDSFTDLGADFSDPAGLSLVTSLGGSWPAGGAIVAHAGVNTVTITLPSAVNAVAFYVGSQDYSFFTITVDDGSGPYVNGYLEGSATSGAFFGITTTASFTTFTITSQASVDTLTLDNISIGSAGAGETPEAATLLLVATGLFLMGWMRRRTPRRAADQAASRGTVRTMSTGITPA